MFRNFDGKGECSAESDRRVLNSDSALTQNPFCARLLAGFQRVSVNLEFFNSLVIKGGRS